MENMEKFGTDFINHSGKIDTTNDTIDVSRKKLLGLYFGAGYAKPD